MAKRKLTWSLAAIGVAGTLGAGTLVGISSAHASPPKASAQQASEQRVALASGHSGEAGNSGPQLTASRSDGRGNKQLAARRAAVVKAVVKKFPKAKVISVTARRDGAWVVVLVLKDHRIGTVVVSRKLRVGPFKKLVAHKQATMPKHPTPTAPSTTGTSMGDGAMGGHNW